MNIIEARNLSKVFKSGKKAVDDLSFNVQEGMIFGFLGPNGAGKSTTIRMLTTLSQPSSGIAKIAGYDLLTETTKIRENIGYVAQDPGVDIDATGRENLILQGRLYHLPNKVIIERVHELLKLVELEDDANRLVRTYSGGMKKRLDIACGLIHRPKLLFLDEPTTGLDPHTRAHLWNYIKKLNQQEGVTIFLTTHYLDEADVLSNRISIIDHGQIITEGTPDDLKDDISGDSINLYFYQETIQQAEAALKDHDFIKDIQVGNDNNLRIWVFRGAENLPIIFRILESINVQIKSVELSRPSLDDVFLKHTGRSLRENSVESQNPSKGV